MTDDFIPHIAAILLGAVIGGMLATVITAGAWSDPGKHHHEAYDAHGNLTCEFCKALAEKGRNKDGK